jgi:hypothetical protein
VLGEGAHVEAVSGDRPEDLELAGADSQRVAHALLDAEELGAESLLVVVLKMGALGEIVS